ncbi:SDR family NAD(P)-dependent oxidoreductase [Leptothrix discophora]|uniref:SDR family NAD(P)-dependent oxidoreductase n=1 Tax=Leptothrix discophora TaxID=89 RepID=A0ABT9G6B0_LEPDI|nr:SDR family NAD(P)-dependent oxidoreductase [Leptothrix discophora]MDP4302023.1 SDR family NAD(P)-dependent oxidoreductase [Leptothrix discophora]
MKIEGQVALVTGAGSGLGAAVAQALAARGAKVALLDINEAGAQAGASALNDMHGVGTALACRCDITDTASVTAALDAVQATLGAPRLLMNIAGIGSAKRVIQRDGSPAPLEDFERVVRINLVGTYNVTRLAAARMAAQEPATADGERGVIVNTASVAAYDGQVGQEAYAASKGGVVGLTLPLARDLAQWGIRVCTVAPGLFATPLMNELPEPVQQSLAASIPFPKRLGQPEEFAALACHIVENGHLNGEVIRLDGALRMAPR